MYKKTIIALTAITFILAFAAIGLGIAWGIDAKKKNVEAEGYRVAIENNYRRAYYDFSYELAQANDALNKALVSSGNSVKQSLLTDAGESCVKAVASASVVATVGDNDALAFVNKAGDYASFLALKIGRGEELSEDDYDNLTSVYVSLSAIERTLKENEDKINASGYSFMETLDKDNGFANGLRGVQTDIAYPSLIYDGAFSDSLEERVPKGVEGEELTIEQAKETAKAYLPDGADLEFVTSEEGEIPSYIFESENSYLTVTKRGGLLVSLTTNAKANKKNHTESECEEVGKAYLNKIGLENMTAVWISDYDNVYYINYVYEQDDLIYYPDMIKIKVSSEDMRILGVEALNYLYNHTVRTTERPEITSSEAIKKANKLNVENVRLAVIPTDGGNETLAYEICGTRGDDFYYVYVSAVTGDEIKIMRVVDSGKGKLIA